MSVDILFSGHPIRSALAIIGMEVYLPGSEDLAAFSRAIYAGRQQFTSAPQRAFQDPLSGRTAPFGAYLQRFDIDLEKLFLTPDDVAALSAGDLLLLRAVQRALEDAGLNTGSTDLRIALIIQSGAPSSPGSVAASAFSKNGNQPAILPYLERLVEFSTPTIYPPAELNFPIMAMRNMAGLFASNQADVVLVAASSLLEDPSAAPAGFSTDPASVVTLSFDQNFSAWPLGEGAVALVFEKASSAAARGQRIYACLQGAAEARPSDGIPVPRDVAAACRASLDAAGARPAEIGLLEAAGCGLPEFDRAEIGGLLAVYQPSSPIPAIALGSTAANFGWSGSVSALAGLAKSALCLYERFLPALPGWSAPKGIQREARLAFYAPTESRPWFRSRYAPPRAAAVNWFGPEGSFMHLVLREAEVPRQPVSASLPEADMCLFPLAGADLSELLDGLAWLRTRLSSDDNLSAISADAFQRFLSHSGAPFALALLGSTPAETLREVDYASKGIPRAVEAGSDWQTPLGSYFTPSPLGKTGDVAFVYPGAFNSYPGVGRDLFYLFPQLFDLLSGMTADLGGVIREQLLYPRSLYKPSKEDLDAAEASLISDAVAMLSSGTGLSVMFTHVLQDIFQVHPTAAFGYSLGENSMMFAAGVWADADEPNRLLSTAPLFRSRLSGPMNAVRESWGLPLADEGDSANGLWSNYVLMAPPDVVREALKTEPRVYLTHVNTPRQVVIGGEPAGCQRVISALKCPSLKAPFDYALHCPAMESEYPALMRQHCWPVARVPDVALYSAADYQRMPIEQNKIADRIGRTLTTCLDFPRLVQRVYEDGARIFIELGAGANCSKWIEDTLKAKPFLSVSINRRGSDDLSSILRVLARLVSHQVNLDLSPLFPPARDRYFANSLLSATIELGRQSAGVRRVNR